MKIVQVMLAKGFGGAERSFVDITNALSARGHEVIPIVESRSKARSLLSSSKIYPVKVRSHWDPIAQFQLSRILSKETPDLVHAHLARAAKLAGTAATKLGIPSLVKTHNYVNLKYYREVSCLVPTTKDQENYLLSSGIAKDKIDLIPNFTALRILEEMENRGSFVSTAEPHIVAVGRLVGKKGFDILLKALKMLSKKHRFRLTIVGDGIERDNLEQLASKLDLTANINFAGWCDEIQAILDTADVFALPSLDEPFGIVILEAMARGVPIVSTRTQGPGEILDEKTAILVEPGSVDAMADGLNRLLDDPAQASVRATNALALCRAKYSRDVVVDQYLALYKKLLGKS